MGSWPLRSAGLPLRGESPRPLLHTGKLRLEWCQRLCPSPTSHKAGVQQDLAWSSQAEVLLGPLHSQLRLNLSFPICKMAVGRIR